MRGVPDQRVDLVDQQHQRLRICCRPAHQRLAEPPVRAVLLQVLAHRPVYEVVLKSVDGSGSQAPQQRLHRSGGIFPGCLAAFEVYVQAAVLPLRVEPVLQR